MRSSVLKLKNAPTKKNSKKKKLVKYSESIILDPLLLKTFIGKRETLSSLIEGYKVSLKFDISKDQESIILTVSAKHRNQVQIVVRRLIERYNKIVLITNNLITYSNKKI